VRGHAKAPSTRSAHSAELSRVASRRARGLFGIACLCVLGLAAFLGSGAPTAGAVSACPNEAFRLAQHATQLPDCRAFEKVSPEEKGNGDIVGDGATTVAGIEGDGVAFNTRTPFGDTIGSGGIGQTQYVARRTDQGWTVHGITPTPRPDADQGGFFTGTRVQLYSEDVRTAIVRAYDLPAVSDDAPLRNNLYVEDTETRELQTVSVSQVDPLSVFDFVEYPQVFWGFSADARHVSFVAKPDPFFEIVTQFLPEAAPGVSNVYQWDEGVLHLVGILPDSACGTPPCVPDGGSDQLPTNLRGAVSADGSRTLFNAVDSVVTPGGQPQLYQRIDNERTVWISEPEFESAPPEPSGVELKGATPDGRIVFFTTDSQLIEADENGGTDLYRWTDTPDPTKESNLTLIPDVGGGLIGMSDDGEHVYYHTAGDRMKTWDSGITRLISENVVGEQIGFDLMASPGYARVTPDGMFLAFLSSGVVDGPGGHGLTGEVTNKHLEMYLYSLADESLTCASCPPTPASSDATVLPATTLSDLTIGNAGFRPRYLSEDGRVFFSTAESLVPEDVNGVLDAYQYDPASGEASLLSSGRGKDRSTFADASASGEDVFIVSRQKLVPSDRDELVDLYDVGVGGGFPEPLAPASAPCEGEACQAGQAASPGAAPIGSRAIAAGNPRPPCAKSKRRVRRNGRARCVRKHHRKRDAKHNRRAAK
jgi:hypothetical protein